jgi:CubicO group peptidase (beta-lactamase class C family)
LIPLQRTHGGADNRMQPFYAETFHKRLLQLYKIVDGNDWKAHAVARASILIDRGGACRDNLGVACIKIYEGVGGQDEELVGVDRLPRPDDGVPIAWQHVMGGIAALISRLAQPLAADLASGQPVKVIDVSKEPKNDSGGAGAVSTAADYLRFSQMLLNGGQLDGTRILSRTTVALMTSDHLGTRIATPFSPGELLLGTPGYTFGLGFAVRPGGGIAGVPGSAGEFMWAGYAGTYFWVDPKEELTAVYMSQAPSPIRAYYRKLVKQLVYGALSD